VLILDPAHQLEGHALDNDWTVGAKLRRDPGATGGNFSVSYGATSATGARHF
jgi:hypothetical protein